LSTSSSAQLRRATEFVHGIQDRGAQRHVPFKWGTALLNDDFPRVHDLNFLRVESVPQDVTPEALAEEADHLMEGLKHRRLELEDQALGDRLSPRFKELGWEVVNLLFMEAKREPDRHLPPGVAREVDLEDHLHVREQSLRQDPEIAKEEETIRQLRDCFRVYSKAGNMRQFAAFVDGEPVSSCELYSDGETGQIEGVLTLEEHRNRGLGVAIVLLALQEAKKAGHDMVFLIAEDDDWPKELYTKLGFDPIGRTHEFKIADVSKVGQPKDS
jgi:GNAT superfamily N-acetyltransferase